MPEGKVKFFNEDKGWGKIEQSDGKLIFVHHTGIAGTGFKKLVEGQSVTFDIEKGDKGPKAVNVISRDKGLTFAPQTSSLKVSHGQRDDSAIQTCSPYSFRKRDRSDSRKLMPTQFHDIINDNHYDVAFEIEWTTLTPTAANPCVDPDPKIGTSPPGCNEGEYTGYNKRWLSTDNKLVISPFTVKSAIANGFANQLGGCYRVMPESRKEAHKPLDQGQYPYTGAYKRYRAAMDGSSKPGVIKSITVEPNGDRKVTINPVKEYYFDQELSLSLKPGQKPVYATIQYDRGFRPSILSTVSNNKSTEAIELEYHGEYSYGMNGQFFKDKHKHRFIKRLKDPKTGEDIEITGTIKARDFLSEDSLKEFVYMGNYRKRPEDPGTGELWYDNLNDLAAECFVYYEVFAGQITNIGKNFQFKALFLHEDTVPGDQKACNDINKLCPRCRMFGMTAETENNEKEANGFKGRFKSSSLVCDKQWKFENDKPANFPFICGEQPKLKEWLYADKNRIAYQSLLPIQGPPKPNKRDVNGYFDKNTGEIRGAKIYKHGCLDSAENINNVDNAGGDYTHRLRNYAQVCETGLSFTGTIGAENCSVEEIAALLILLRSDIANHGFKIGLGKAFGMGSISSTIKTIWIRTKENYDNWVRIENIDSVSVTDLENILEGHFKGIKKELVIHEEVRTKLNSMDQMEERRLEYPMPVQRENNRNVYYWDKFNRQGS